MKTFLSLVIFLILSIHSSSWVVAGADHEGLTYGIRVNDSMSRINKQTKKYNLKAERFNITSEDGKLVGIRLIRDKKTVLIAALFKDRVRWTDVLSKGTKINGGTFGVRFDFWIFVVNLLFVCAGGKLETLPLFLHVTAL